jgi:hypothetical protein
MADNTTLPTGTGGDVIATDDVTTLNGGASSAVKVQRVKVGFGTDNNYRDTSAQFALPVDVDSKRTITYYGRGCSFRIPGRAGTTGQKLFSLHNASGSAVIVDLERLTVDYVPTVVKAVTVLPPSIRLYKVTVLPTNGTIVTKVSRDSAFSSSASVTLLGDASADGVSSAVALTATLPAGAVVTQMFAPRLITAAGYEMIDTFAFLEGVDQKITLRPLEGIVLMLDYTLATQNPTTDMWSVDCKWTEYTAAT